jgi:Zn-dependent protease
METNVKLGKFIGIPIGLNRSWFLIFIFLSWSLAMGYFPSTYPDMNTLTAWLLAGITALMFFGSVLAHELGHSVIALRNDIPVRGITLFIFGGVAQIEREPRTPGAEFRIAIAGPLTSLGLAVLFAAVGTLGASIPLLEAPSMWLARTNLVLALFNLIPGFPLDGGRIFRALVWKLSGNFSRATQIASISGQVVAFGFIGLGVFSLFSGNISNGIWLGMIGWFLQNAASSSYANANIENALAGATVDQVMKTGITVIPHLTSLQRIVDEYVLARGEHTFLVSDNGSSQGILTLQTIASIPQRKWPFTTAKQAMVPLSLADGVEPDTELVEAVRKIQETRSQSLVVVEQGQLVGTISQDDVMNFLRLKSRLNA